MVCFLQPFPLLPATLFVKESYVLCRIYWLYLESIFSKGTVADISSPILSWSVRRSEMDKKWKKFKT